MSHFGIPVAAYEAASGSKFTIGRNAKNVLIVMSDKEKQNDLIFKNGSGFQWKYKSRQTGREVLWKASARTN